MMAKIKIPESQLEDAVREGRFSFAPDQRVNVIGTDGELYDVPGSQLKDALGQGYRIQTSEEKAVADYVEENKGVKGAVKVALGQFADEALLSVPETILDHTQSPLEIKKRNAIKEYHDTANTIGGITGFGASMLVGGPVFKGAAKVGTLAERAVATKLAAAGVERGANSLAKDILARTATNAARLGVEGTVVSAPKALTEAALGDYDAAAESLMAGGGIGVAFGLTGGVLGKGLDALSKKVSAKSLSEGLKELSDERAAKALGFSKSQLNKLKGHQDEAEAIGDYMMNAKTADGQAIITPLSTTEQIYNNVLKYKDEAGQKLGNIYEQLENVGIDKADVLNLEGKLRTMVQQDYAGELMKPERAILESIITDLQRIRLVDAKNIIEGPLAEGVERSAYDTAATAKFSDVKREMDRIASVAWPKGHQGGQPTERQKVAAQVWGLLRNEIDAAAEVAAKKTGDETLVQTLNESRKAYNTALKVEKSLVDKIKGTSGNKLIGLTDTITGVGAAAVDPISAIPAVLAKKAFEKYGNQVGAGFFKKSSEGVLMAEQFMDRVKARLDEIPFLMGEKGASTGTSRTLGAAAQFLDDDSGQGRKMAIERIKDVAADAMANPERNVDMIAQRLQGMQDSGAEVTSERLSGALVKAAKYIADNVPKDQRAKNPFDKSVWTPSDQEISAFERKLSVVLDPFAAIDALAAGNLTKEHVEALAYNYPRIYDSMRSRILNQVAEDEKAIPYQKRINLSLLLGLDADPTLRPDFIMRLQDSFAGAPAAPAETARQGSVARTSGLEKMNPRETHQTETQRLLTRT